MVINGDGGCALGARVSAGGCTSWGLHARANGGSGRLPALEALIALLQLVPIWGGRIMLLFLCDYAILPSELCHFYANIMLRIMLILCSIMLYYAHYANIMLIMLNYVRRRVSKPASA